MYKRDARVIDPYSFEKILNQLYAELVRDKCGDEIKANYSDDYVEFLSDVFKGFEENYPSPSSKGLLNLDKVYNSNIQENADDDAKKKHELKMEGEMKYI